MTTPRGVPNGIVNNIDLFAGPGGWDEGLRMIGRTDVLGIEWDESACLTAEAAAARPAETVSESVPAHHATPDVAELRRLLACASPLPWQWEPASGKSWPLGDESLVTTSGDPVLYGWGYDASGIDATAADRALIAAAVNALPTLLDHLAHMTEDRDNARAEVERLTALAEAVREYAAARQANIDHGPLLSTRKAAHDALLAALARLDEETQQ